MAKATKLGALEEVSEAGAAIILSIRFTADVLLGLVSRGSITLKEALLILEQAQAAADGSAMPPKLAAIFHQTCSDARARVMDRVRDAATEDQPRLATQTISRTERETLGMVV